MGEIYFKGVLEAYLETGFMSHSISASGNRHDKREYCIFLRGSDRSLVTFISREGGTETANEV